MTISATTQGLRMGVATSSSRPAVPFEGQIIYETDTDKVLVYNGTAWKQVPTAATAGAVLQIVSANISNGSGTTIATTTYTATGNTATITPSSSSSKILIIVAQANRKTNGNAATEAQSRLYRGASAIDTNQTYSTCYTGTALELRVMNAVTFLDSPSTTSATTYTMYGSASSGTASFDFLLRAQ